MQLKIRKAKDLMGPWLSRTIAMVLGLSILVFHHGLRKRPMSIPHEVFGFQIPSKWAALVPINYFEIMYLSYI